MQNQTSPLSYFLLPWKLPEAGFSPRKQNFRSRNWAFCWLASQGLGLALKPAPWEPAWGSQELTCFYVGTCDSLELRSCFLGFVLTPHVNILLLFSDLSLRGGKKIKWFCGFLYVLDITIMMGPGDEYPAKYCGTKFLSIYTFTRYPSRELGTVPKGEVSVIIHLKELTLKLWRLNKQRCNA